MSIASAMRTGVGGLYEARLAKSFPPPLTPPHHSQALVAEGKEKQAMHPALRCSAALPHGRARKNHA